ncbi:redoxin family protein [Akkermansiaceae bacterium]|nr:redoxin family protein [Akkermansiaceae bacterium]
MKLITTLLAFCIASAAHAGYETWTSADGRTASMELVSVKEADGAKTGTFRMRNGKTVTLAAKDLSADDAKRLDDWKDPSVPEVVSQPSVFDDVLDGNLVILDGKKLSKHEPTAKPTQYYVFYYTASWCPPCQAFTPSLVDFYNKNKNEKFELVLISSDSDEDAMEGYAKDKKMPWPQLKHSKVGSFKKGFNHGVSGIPSVIVCDLKGEIVSRDGRNLAELEKLVK